MFHKCTREKEPINLRQSGGARLQLNAKSDNGTLDAMHLEICVRILTESEWHKRASKYYVVISKSIIIIYHDIS